MPQGTIRGIATADLHLGIDNVGPPNENGTPARVDDFLQNFQIICDHAIKERVDLLAIIGDLTKGRNPPQRILKPLLNGLADVTAAGIIVLLVKGNHDGDSEPGRPNVLDTAALLHDRIVVYNQPRCDVLPFNNNGHGEVYLNVVALPWPRLKWALADHETAGLTYEAIVEAANAGLRQRIADLIGHCDPKFPTLLLGHLAVLGADKSSEQWMTLGFEPTITMEDIPPVVDLSLFGHYHKGDAIVSVKAETGEAVIAAYCGSIAKIDFGEEGQEKFWWEFEFGGPTGKEVRLEPHLLPDRPFRTLDFIVHESTPPEMVNDAFQQFINSQGGLDDTVVRCRIEFGTAEQSAAFCEGAAETGLRRVGVWWIAGIDRKVPRAARRSDTETPFAAMGEVDLLRHYLTGQDVGQERLQDLLWRASNLMVDRPALDRGG